MSDDITELLEEAGIPVTRENYIDLNWGGEPKNWTAEQEGQLPKELQDWSLFEMRNGEMVLKSATK